MIAGDDDQEPISFAAGLGSRITLTSGPIVIGQNLSFSGPGAGALAVSGSGSTGYSSSTRE